MTKGEQTRREIVEKAAPLFNQKGYEGTSLSDLMSVTGLQKGGIYRHFTSKEELATEAFDYAWKKAVRRRLDGIESSADAVDRLKKMVSNFVELRSELHRMISVLKVRDSDINSALHKFTINNKSGIVIEPDSTSAEKILAQAAGHGWDLGPTTALGTGHGGEA